MQPFRHARQRTTWWVLVLWLLVTLAPGVSRASAFVQGQIAPWSVVCSALGETSDHRAGAGSAGIAGGADELKHLTEHCPACSLQSDLQAPPPAAPATLALPPLRDGLPRLFLQAPRPLFAWASAQPRAPPR